MCGQHLPRRCTAAPPYTWRRSSLLSGGFSVQHYGSLAASCVPDNVSRRRCARLQCERARHSHHYMAQGFGSSLQCEIMAWLFETSTVVFFCHSYATTFDAPRCKRPSSCRSVLKTTAARSRGQRYFTARIRSQQCETSESDALKRRLAFDSTVFEPHRRLREAHGRRKRAVQTSAAAKQTSHVHLHLMNVFGKEEKKNIHMLTRQDVI